MIGIWESWETLWCSCWDKCFLWRRPSVWTQPVGGPLRTRRLGQLICQSPGIRDTRPLVHFEVGGGGRVGLRAGGIDTANVLMLKGLSQNRAGEAPHTDMSSIEPPGGTIFHCGGTRSARLLLIMRRNIYLLLWKQHSASKSPKGSSSRHINRACKLSKSREGKTQKAAVTWQWADSGELFILMLEGLSANGGGGELEHSDS